MQFRAAIFPGTTVIETIVLIALLIFFIKEPGCAAVLLGMAVMVGVCIWYFAIQVPAERERQAAAREEQARAAVTVQMRYDGDSCPDLRFPLWTRIHNGSDRVVKSVEWDLRATTPGHSSDLLEGNGRYSDDHILMPGWSVTNCYSLASPVRKRREAAGLAYEARVGVVGWR